MPKVLPVPEKTPRPEDTSRTAWKSAPPELRRLRDLLAPILENAPPEVPWAIAGREHLLLPIQPSGQRALVELFPTPRALVEGLLRGDPRMVLGNKADFERCLQPTLRIASAIDPVATGVAAMTVPLRIDTVSWAVATALGASGDPAALDRLLEAFASPPLRNVAVVGIHAARGPGVDLRLLESFRESVAREGEPFVPNHAAIELAKLLGAHEVEASVPDLLAVWAVERAGDLRAAVANALVDIGTREALSAVAPEIEDRHGGVQTAAVRAVFLLDPEGAFDRLAPLFAPDIMSAPARSHAPIGVLQVLARDASLERAPRRGLVYHGFLRSDPRWADVCAHAAASEATGHYALAVLPYLDPPRALEVLLSLVGVADIEELGNALLTLSDRRAIAPLTAKLGVIKKKRDQAVLKKVIAELEKVA